MVAVQQLAAALPPLSLSSVSAVAASILLIEHFFVVAWPSAHSIVVVRLQTVS